MSKSLAPDQTDVGHKFMHRVKGTDFLIGYAFACLSSHAPVQEFLSRKLQVCKVLGGGIHYFPAGLLAYFYGNLYNLWF